MKYSIGVIGGGFVGKALINYFGAQTKFYDKYKSSDSLDDVCVQDIIFLAVPTPYTEKGFDKSALDESFQEISARVKNKIVIIKSTVLPGTTQSYQKEYPHLKIMFNPEFLTEVTPDQNMAYPDRQIIGFTDESYSCATDLLSVLPNAPFERIVPSAVAEMTKYFNNTWFATKVTFANQIFDLCEAAGIDYDLVKECAAADRRMTGYSHIDVIHDDYRGYGGKCLPKDTRAFIQFGDDHGVSLDLLKTAETYNNTLQRKFRKEGT